jgi:hypothetical protein
MEERRRGRRDRTFLNGLIAFNNRNSTVDCLVRNLSGEGAKITIPATAPTPGEFDLMLPTRGESRQARQVWRHGEELGVTFAA